MTELYREWALNTASRKGSFIRESTLEALIKTVKDPGYSSLYAFKEDDAKELIFAKSSKGMDRYTPHADKLFIDIDTEEQAPEELAKIEAAIVGLKYEVFVSGGKGYHVVIPHQFVGDVCLPFSQKAFVQGLGSFEVDMSLYRADRLISLPGRIHPKTKARKTKIKEVNGVELDLVLVQKPTLDFDFTALVGDFPSMLIKLADVASYSPSKGDRHMVLWGTARDLKKCGVPYELGLSLMIFINDGWSCPKTEVEVAAAVQQAYKVG